MDYKISIFLFAFVTILVTEARSQTDILYIGDSHSYGCFGSVLDSHLREVKNNKVSPTVFSRALCGSSTASWLSSAGPKTSCGFRSCDIKNNCNKMNSARSEPFPRLFKSVSPKLTIIALGSNMLKADWDDTMAEVSRMISLSMKDGGRCIWIGPPQAQVKFMPIDRYEKFVSDLRKTVTKNDCLFVDSNEKTDRIKISDKLGLHYGCKEGTLWAEKVFAEIKPTVEAFLGQGFHKKSTPESRPSSGAQ